MKSRLIHLIIVLTLSGAPASAAQKKKTIAGPVSASVTDIYDGDTIEVLANVWPGTRISVRVRIRGIDAPEIRARCAGERRAAINARERLRRYIADKPVFLTDIRGGKYFGRVLANVRLNSGANLQEVLLASGLVRPYRGNKRKSWC